MFARIARTAAVFAVAGGIALGMAGCSSQSPDSTVSDFIDAVGSGDTGCVSELSTTDLDQEDLADLATYAEGDCPWESKKSDSETVEGVFGCYADSESSTQDVIFTLQDGKVAAVEFGSEDGYSSY